jgi:hypothetical protein
MRFPARYALATLALAAATAHAEEAAEPPTWEVAVTGYWNAIRQGGSYASGIAIADRGALHLEGRANYEAVHAQSVFAGWNFAFGKEEGVTFEVTPILGGVTGAIHGPIAGFEATVTAGRFDFYIEGEHVDDRSAKDASYNYAWSELGFRPTESVRLGLVGQRTRAYGGDREFQRGGFVQLEWKQLAFGIYWFNPGTNDQVIVSSVGVSF